MIPLGDEAGTGGLEICDRSFPVALALVGRAAVAVG